MANQALNNSQLEAMLMPKIRIAVDYVVQKIWNENRALIRKIVYNSYWPTEYERTNQFANIGETDVKISGNHAIGSFFYNSENLIPGEHGQHSSIAYNTYGEPMTTYLVEIIYQGLAGDFTGEYKYAKQNPKFAGEAWTKKRDVWEKLNKYITSHRIRKLFEEGMKYAGIKFKRNSYGDIVKTFGDSFSITITEK